ncbi:MAG: GNAT family N-acetyltransferase [Lentisphaerae bacterium]|nr:GNAT family N-acetyltransferase [Lentisphaerota bacterium]MCP4099995.1 GNAT family N-acetyltransferase [Lentisphaerota bacterium]
MNDNTDAMAYKNLVIREFLPEDAVSLALVAERAFCSDRCDSNINCIECSEEYSNPEWYCGLNADAGKCMVVLKDDEIIGGVVVAEKDDENWVDCIFIDPDYQQRGIGSFAINKVENEFYPESKVWKIDSPVCSRGSHEFYMKNGFIKEGPLNDDWLLFIKFKTLSGNINSGRVS